MSPHHPAPAEANTDHRDQPAPTDQVREPDRPDDPRLLDYNAWLFWERADEERRTAQRARQRAVLATTDPAGDSAIGDRTFLSELAMVQPTALRLGARCYVAAHAYLTGTVTAGDDCTLNPFAVVRGTVTLGNGVRIGAHASILGFNHGMAPDRPVFRQPTSERGIVVGDDVWIGSHAVLLDGVTVGAHAVIGAGAVVTRDVPEWAVVGGNPARVIRDRRAPGRSRRDERAELGARLGEFAERAREQTDAVVARVWEPDAVAPDGTPTGRYLDAPDAPPTLRAHADAVEILALLHGRAPAQLPAAEHVRRLRQGQDPATGLTAGLSGTGRHGPAPAGFGADGNADYHVLSLGYALDLLGSSFTHPVGAVAGLDADELRLVLAELPWREGGWSAGAGVDTLGTALYWNLSLDPAGPDRARGQLDVLFGWLLTHCRPGTGLWSEERAADGLLQPVNGYYRAARGSFAQFGLPVPYPERVVDTVLRHAADPRHFGPGRTTACNVLDVAHPLWLAARQAPNHRAEEVSAWAAGQCGPLLERWVDGEGFPFRQPPVGGPAGRGDRPGLQGTEMWLATLWYLADLVGVSESLGYRPAGVHRPEPAVQLD
ncbi:acyltransferase [Streptomyces triticirhizae]|uniref:Acyltransferase n=1 Tax=Streptomyces triticirhizae TaxID=2483353 RepID=A0A3M2LTV5_9ACTN|nr:acyltransferase [Streptomyces triticirhizae]RMI39485.1 acyltransferase [Streptomyces triticirhizae]